MRPAIVAGVVMSVALSLGLAQQAKAETYKVDPVHSFVLFRVGHLNVGYIHGRFNDPTGQFSLDEKDPTKASFDVSVDVDKLDTHNEGRDKDLKGAGWFNVKQYPTITFKSKEVKVGSEKNMLEVTGDLTLHGVTKTITVPVQVVGVGKGMKGEPRAGIEAAFTVKRSEFEMKAMPGGAGEEVRLTVALEGTKE